MKIFYESFLKTIVLVGISIFIFLFIPFIPINYTICPFMPPCYSSIRMTTPSNFLEEKFMLSYVEKLNLHHKGQESFMDAVHREERKIFIGVSSIVSIILFIFLYKRKINKIKNNI